MTIASETNSVIHLGAGTLGPFTIPFKFLENDDIIVVKTLIADGTQTTLVLTTDYTLTGAGEEEGELNLTAAHGALSASYKLTIYRDPDALQGTDLTPFDKFPAESVERALDKLTMLALRLKSIFTGKALRHSDGDVSGISAQLPTPVASAFLRVKSDLSGYEYALDPGLLSVSAFVQTLLDDASADVFLNTLINGATAEPLLAVGDLFGFRDVSAATGRKVTVQQLYDAINVLSAPAALATNDVLSGFDVSVGGARKYTLEEVIRIIGSLTEIAGTSNRLDGGADSIGIYDASVPGARRVSVQALMRKNAIINGAFDIWQRGTSFAAAATGTYTADRWTYLKLGTTAVHTVQRSTDVPSVAQAGHLINYSLHLDCTTADAAVAAGDYVLLRHKIEGYNWRSLAQRAVTLSFWVKSTKTGVHCVALSNSIEDRSCVAEFTINAADTWEFKSVTFPASPSAGTWDYTSGIGINVTFPLHVGSTFHTAAGAWAAGTFWGTANEVNDCDNVVNDFKITEIQLEPGNTATDFEQRAFQDELSLCQRYYCKTFQYGTAPAQNVGVANAFYIATDGNVLAGGTWEFPMVMRATPTVTTYSPANASANVWDATNAVQRVIAANPTGAGGDRAFHFSFVPGVGAANNIVHIAADAEL